MQQNPTKQMYVSTIIIYHMMTGLGQLGSGNGLLPDDIKPLPELMLTYHQRWFTWEKLKKTVDELSQ